MQHSSASTLNNAVGSRFGKMLIDLIRNNALGFDMQKNSLMEDKRKYEV